MQSYLFRYLSYLFALVAGLYLFVYMRGDALLTQPLDFYSMSDDSVLILSGIGIEQEGEIKIAFQTHYPPPLIGAFGNHQICAFGRGAFKSADKKFFFNFNLTNIALPQILTYLRFLEMRNLLPKKTLLIQISSPNGYNGRYIIDETSDFPRSIRMGKYGWIKEIAWWYQNELLRGLRFESVLQAFKASHPIEERIIVPSHASSLKPSMRNDGSRYFPSELPLQLSTLPEREIESGLKQDDDGKITDYLRQIHSLGVRTNRKVIFFVPPLFEIDPKSKVDAILTSAIKQVPEIKVLDHRDFRSRKEFFINATHPSPQYFQYLVEELRKNDLILE